MKQGGPWVGMGRAMLVTCLYYLYFVCYVSHWFSTQLSLVLHVSNIFLIRDTVSIRVGTKCNHGLKNCRLSAFR